MLFYDGDLVLRHFELRMKVCIHDSGNSGIYFRTRTQNSGYPDRFGYEAQISSLGHANRNKTGSLLRINSVRQSPVRDGEWFDYHILAHGRRIVLTINGKVMSEYTEAANSAQRRPQGRALGLQSHEPGHVEFRDIRVKVLSETENQ